MKRDGESEGLPGQEGFRPIRIYLLGGFRVERDGTPVPDAAWVRPQARTLVKLLAVEPSHRLHRDQIIDRFWPESSTAHTAGNLRRLIAFARRALVPEGALHDPGDLLSTRGEMIALSPALVWLDTDAFEAAAQEALDGGSVQQPEAALALYAGELLPEDRYEPWTEDRREELAGLHRAVLLALARALGARGEWEPATARLRQLLNVDAAHEEAHRELMRVLAAAGKRGEALRQYERCREALAEQLGVEPDAETEVLVAAIRSHTGGAAVQLPPAALMSSPGPLVGRARALAVLLDTPIFGSGSPGFAGHVPPHAAPVGERRPVVFVRGEAGIGKTRLAAEVARVAAGRGATVLWGSCYRRIAYGPFAEALEQYAAGLPRADRSALAATHPELAQALPSLARFAHAPTSNSAGDQLRLFAAAGRFLIQIAESAPLLLVLDDVHLADDASLHLLVYLARLAPRHSWLILCTYREEDVAPRGELVATMAALQRAGASRRLELLRLGRAECDALAEQILGAPVEEQAQKYLHDVSLGNPLFVTELIAGLCASGELQPATKGWQLAPGVAGRPFLPGGRVADLIQTRVEALGDSTRRLLTVAAAGGMAISLHVLLRATTAVGLAHEEALTGIEQAISARILEEREGEYAFSHPLFRETLYAQLTWARRESLHRALGLAIEAVQPGEVEMLAFHFNRSGDREKQIVYLEKAGDHARSIYANALAESHYRALLDLLEAGDPAAPRVRIRLAAVLNLTARHDEALALLEATAADYEAAARSEELAHVLAAIGQTHAARGTPEAAIERLQEALSDLDGQVSSVTLAGMAISLGHVFHACGRYVESLEAAERAEALSRPYAGEAEGRQVHAQAEVRRATALGMCRRSSEARRVLAAALPEVEAAGDLDNLARAVNNLAVGEQLAGNFAAQQRYQRRALEIAERLGDPARVAVYRAALGQAAFFTSDLNMPESLQLAEEGHRELKELGASWHAAYAGFYLGWVLLGLGRWEEARQVLAESVETAWNDPQVSRVSASTLACIDCFEGDPERALARLEPFMAAADAEDLDVTLVNAVMVWALTALGDLKRALPLAERTVRKTRALGYPLYLLEALLARGMARVERGEWAQGEADLLEALALARQMGYVGREAAVLVRLSRLDTLRGNLETAHRQFADARVLLLRLGGEGTARLAGAIARVVPPVGAGRA